MRQLIKLQYIAGIALIGIGFSIGKAIPKERDYQIQIDGNTAYVIKACNASVEVFSKAEQELKMNYLVKGATPITDGKCGTIAIRYEVVRLLD